MDSKKANSLEQDVQKINEQRVRSEAYSALIIKEQEGLIEAANSGIEKINSDLKALRSRLEPYVKSNPVPMDEKGNELRFRYTRRLQERNALEKARSVAEESVVASKLHMIPGELTREPKAPNERGYSGLEV